MSKVIILGAKGRFGRAATTAFTEAGWDVTLFARNWPEDTPPQAQRITGQAQDVAALRIACAEQDVIVNAINPPYEDWARELPAINAAVIAAARHSGAHVIIPGNVYNYGANAPATLSENTMWKPTTRKGKLRVTMEEAYRGAGVPTIVLRGGDYLEVAKSGNWFDAHIAPKAHEGVTLYPGPLDRAHAWAYLPDIARAAVMLAERRAELGVFEQFCYEGYTLTGAELVHQISAAVNKPQKIKGMPWFLLPLLGIFKPTIREVYEMRYLWRVLHRMDGTKLRAFLPDFTPTPVEVAFKDMLAR